MRHLAMHEPFANLNANPSGTAHWRNLMADPAQWALFVDIDGTLLDVAPTPDAARVPPHLTRTLERIAGALGGALALSTGRRVASADRLFAPLRLVTSGVHGTELRTSPRGEVAMLAPPIPSGLVDDVSRVTKISPGILVEQKGAGLAVHYRNAPGTRATLDRELERIVGRWHAYDLRPGRRVREILPRGYSKGTALDRLMQLAPFAGRLPLMIGDDHGDEAGLTTARRLGGVGLKVAGEHFRKSGADFDNPASVRAWLSMLCDKPDLSRTNGQG
jgi:trehalose 6-phosphate phosphatase